MKEANVGVQYAPLSQQIHAGRLNKAGDRFLDKSDVTDQVIAAVGQMAIRTGDGEMTFDFDGPGGQTMSVTVTAEVSR